MGIGLVFFLYYWKFLGLTKWEVHPIIEALGKHLTRMELWEM